MASCTPVRIVVISKPIPSTTPWLGGPSDLLSGIVGPGGIPDLGADGVEDTLTQTLGGAGVEGLLATVSDTTAGLGPL